MNNHQQLASSSTERLSGNTKYLNCWIIDLAPPHHMTWNFNYMFDVSTLGLVHVLFIPILTCQLMSISEF